MTAVNFRKLYTALMKKNFVAASEPPLGSHPRAPLIREKIEAGKELLPERFVKGYVDPLTRNLEPVVAKLNAGTGFGPANVETVAGAVYQHAETPLQPSLYRFLAVVSDLYRSFLDAEKRRHLKIALSETVPPLAVFQSDSGKGPFTLKCDQMASLTGGNIGVVSLPYTFADELLFYGCLAHETAGHDVIHADPGLLQEMRDEVHVLFRNADPDWLGLLWDYWMDEAAADVYGVLNMGPTLGLSTALLLSVFVPQLEAPQAKRRPKAPVLRHVSTVISQGRLDEHPTDILRLAVIEGAVSSLPGLSLKTRQSYSRQLSGLSRMLAPNVARVRLTGRACASSGAAMEFRQRPLLATMQEAARKVGAMIATHPFARLGGHSIQDIETWDDVDEKVATRIAARLQANRPIAGLGDDAQILAGLTLAALAQPKGYEAASKDANRSLDHSFVTDPYWGHVPGNGTGAKSAR